MLLILKREDSKETGVRGPPRKGSEVARQGVLGLDRAQIFVEVVITAR